MAENNSDNKERSTTWWIHIDMTVVVVVLAVLVLGYLARNYIISEQKRARDEAERRERLAKEREENESIRREEARKKLEQEREEIRIATEKNVLRLQAEAAAKRAQAELDRAQAEKKIEEERLRQQQEEAANREQQLAEARRRRQEAEENARKQDEAYKNGIIADARDVINKSKKELEEAKRSQEDTRTKMIAYKNKMDYAIKQSQSLAKTVNALNAAHGTVKAAGNTGGVMTYDLSDEIIKTTAKSESVTKEFRDASEGYFQSQGELKRLEGVIQSATARIEGAEKNLAQFGDAAKLAAPVKTATSTSSAPSAPAAAKTYILKDGRRIKVLRAVEAGDTVSVRTEDGKFEAIEKANIEKIEE